MAKVKFGKVEAFKERLVDVVYTLGWLVGVLGLLAMLSGCAGQYVVVAADREVVPVRVIDGNFYERTADNSAEATGWYVPDAVMLDLLK